MEERLRKSDEKVAKMREVVVALRSKSSEVQAICASQQQQIEEAEQKHRAREQVLLKRSEAAERRVAELEDLLRKRGGSEGVATLGRQALPTQLEQLSQAFATAAQLGGTGSSTLDRGVMQSAVSFCEGALGIVKAALATNAQQAAQDQGCRSACLADVARPDSAEGENSQPSFEPTPGDANVERCAVPGKRKKVITELSPAGKRHKQDQRENKALQITDRPGQGCRSGSPGDSDVAAVDIVHASLQTLSDSRPSQEVVCKVAAYLASEMVTTGRCPLQCIIGCMCLALTDCGHATGGLHSGTHHSDNSVTNQSRGEEEVIDLVGDAAVEDIKFACTWYDGGKRYKQFLTALISCAMLLDEAQPTDSRAGSLMDVLCGELQRQLLLGPQFRGRRTDTEDCVLAATLTLIHRLHGDIQAVRVLLLDLLLMKQPDELQALLPTLTAVLTVWPAVLQPPRSADPHGEGGLESVILNLLQELCVRVLADPLSPSDDATHDGSVSATTTSAALSSGPRLAAPYMYELGRKHWHWLDRGKADAQGDSEDHRWAFSKLVMQATCIAEGAGAGLHQCIAALQSS